MKFSNNNEMINRMMVSPISIPKTYYLGDYRYVARVKIGLYMFLDTRCYDSTIPLLFYRCWEEGVARLYKRFIKKGMTYFDVGTNAGYHFLHASKLVGTSGQAIGFDPHPILYGTLRDSIVLNDMQNWARVYPWVISGSKKETTFFYGEQSTTLGSVYPFIKETPTAFEGEVLELKKNTTTIDFLISQEFKNKIPDFVKIDAEGSEPDIIMGMKDLLSSSRSLKIVLEFVPRFFNSLNKDPLVFVRLMRSYNFKIYMIDSKSGRLSLFTDDNVHTFEGDLFLSR